MCAWCLAQVGPELEALVQREFDGGALLQRALELVHLGGGIQAARRLARQEADLVGPPFLLPPCCLLSSAPAPPLTHRQWWRRVQAGTSSWHAKLCAADRKEVCSCRLQPAQGGRL